MARRGRHATTNRLGYGSVLADREYRALFISQCFSLLGDRVAAVALSVLIFDRSHSALLAASVYAATYLPYLFAGPPLAALADRVPRRHMMILSDLSRMILVFAMVIPGLPIGALFALFFTVGCLEPGYTSARGGLIPNIFRDDRYYVATSLSRLVNQFSYLFGFLGGGLILVVLPPRASLAADAATFLLSAALTRFVVRERPVVAAAPGAGHRGILGGLRLVREDPLLLRLIASGTVLAAVTAVPEGVAVTQAHAFHHGPAVVGLLTAAAPCGAFVSVWLAVRFIPPARQLNALRRWAVVAVLFFVVPVVAPSLPLTLACWVLGGAASCYQQPASSLAVRATPDSHRGRVLGVAQISLMLFQGLVLLAAGALATRVSVPVVMAADGGVGALLLGAMLWRWRPVIRLPVTPQIASQKAPNLAISAVPRRT